MRLGIAAVVSLVASTAHAEPVRLQVEGAARIEIFDPDKPAVRRTCVGACTVDLPRHFYRLRVERRPGTYRIDEEIQIAGPTTVAIDQGHTFPRRLLRGLGGFAAGVGLTVTMLTLMYSGPDSAAFAIENRPLGYSVGGTLLVGGLVAIVWSMALGPSVTTSWLERPPVEAAAVRCARLRLATLTSSIAPIVSKSTAGVVWSLTF